MNPDSKKEMLSKLDDALTLNKLNRKKNVRNKEGIEKEMKCSFCGHYIERHNLKDAQSCLEKALESLGETK